MTAPNHEEHTRTSAVDDMDERVEELVRRRVEEEERGSTDDTVPGQASRPQGTGASPATSTHSLTARKDGDIEDAIKAIWARSKESVLARVALIERAARALMQGPLDPELRERAQRQAHRLAGSLGTFGFTRASSLARQLEHIFERSDAPSADEVARVCDMADQLRTELERPPQRDEAGGRQTNAGTALVVISADAALLARLRPRMQASGFAVDAAPDVARALASLDKQPALVVVDLGPEPDTGHTTTLLADLGTRAPRAALVVLAPSRGGETRTAAARAGTRRLVPRDAAPEIIMDAIRAAAPHTASEGLRVILAGDPGRAGFGGAFTTDRLACAATTDPETFLHELERDRPAAVAIDTTHPDVDAAVFGHLLRMEPRWDPVPLVLLVAGPIARETLDLAARLDADQVIPVPSPDLADRFVLAIDRRATRTRDATAPPSTTETSPDPIATLLRRATTNDRTLTLARVRIERAPPGPSDRTTSQLANAPTNETIDEAKAQDHVITRLRAQLGAGDALQRAGRDIIVALYDKRGEPAATWLDATLRVAVADWPGDGAISARAAVVSFPQDGADIAALLTETTARMPPAGTGTTVSRAAPSATRGQARAIDVLLVDDDETLGALLTHALSARGYQSDWLIDGVDAANKLLGPGATIQPRLILLDVNLPSMDGLSLLRRFRDAGLLGRTKVIMLTARVREREVVEALNLGAIDHVGKPFSVPVLLERIRHALGT